MTTPLVEDIETYAQDIVDTVREPLLMLDTTLRVRSANRAFYQTFQVSAEETENRLIYELDNGQWDIPALRTLLEAGALQSAIFNSANFSSSATDARGVIHISLAGAERPRLFSQTATDWRSATEKRS